MKETLIIFYSRTGTTKKIAEEISNYLNSDIEEIIDKKNRTWIIWFLWAGKDAALKKIVEIWETKFDPTNYKNIIIWTPVRDFTMAAAIRTYLTQNCKSLPKNIHFFCTQGSSWDMATFQDMANICWKKPIHTISFTTREVKSDLYRVRLNNFLNKIQDTGFKMQEV